MSEADNIHIANKPQKTQTKQSTENLERYKEQATKNTEEYERQVTKDV